MRWLILICGVLLAQSGCAHHPTAVRFEVGEGLWVEGRVLRTWYYDYQGSPNREWMQCAAGRVREDGQVWIDSTPDAEILYATAHSVGGSCPDTISMLGIVHNHPSGGCFPSSFDQVNQDQRKDRIWVVVCGAETEGRVLRFGVRTLKSELDRFEIDLDEVPWAYP